jgi:hypothetical protein
MDWAKNQLLDPKIKKANKRNKKKENWIENIK